ncbi:peptidoglycan-binding domain-containing protein [Kitasatospora sp. NPDC002040]|uniref:peptidoglycan-binding domain-containing protein n=1 Tax=Kitasatospora sp. NPDC002040 TaxID=3154661 RepID=UPI0033338CE1
MPGAPCPVCGTAGGAEGCPACSLSDATAILPPLDSPELVRPYVAAPAPADPFATQIAPPSGDAFATQLMPPVPPSGLPPHPQGPPPYPPAVPSLQLIPTPPQWTPEPAPANAAAPTPDLGVFGFRTAPGEPTPGGRAERRVQEQVSAGRRRTVIIAAGIGVAAIGAGLALVLSPSDEKPVDHDQALPAPVASYQPTVSPPAAAVVQSPKPSESPSPSPSRSSSKPKPSPSAATSAPADPAPTPTTAQPSPSRTTAAPAPTATGPRVLQRGLQGADVKDMQTRLTDVLWWKYNRSLATGDFDSRTEKAVRDFQDYIGIANLSDPPGVYGPTTRQALERLTD